MGNEIVAMSAAEVAEIVKNEIKSQSILPRAICFDFFDTLVFRTITPEHTKRIAAKQLSAVIGGHIPGSTLYSIRRELEDDLCRRNVLQGKDLEFSLYDLGEELFRLLQIMNSCDFLIPDKTQFVEIFSDIEIAVEKKVQEPCNEIIQLLHWIRTQNISTILISDFYIPERHFLKMLSHHNLSGLFDSIFISADYGLTKGSGKLYGQVCEIVNCNPSDLFMIGDNEHADVNMAIQAGVRPFFIETQKRKQFYTDWEKKNGCDSFKINQLTQLFDDIIEHGSDVFFNEMGITLWFFTLKLFQQLIEKKVRNVFFCSKEGEFLKKLFDVFQQECFGRQIIASHYLIVSRKATFIGSLKALPDEDFSRLFEQYRDLSLNEFILSLNFSQRDVQLLREKHRVDFDTRHQNLQDHEDFQSLLRSSFFIEMYEHYRDGQKENLLFYLHSFKVPFQEEGLYLVDVGWKGSIQNNIFHALDGEIYVQGYFVGLLSPSALTDKNKKTGILFSDIPLLTPYIHAYNNNRSLFEMMLGASHGSADGYFLSSDFSSLKKERESMVYKTLQEDCAGIDITILDLPEERQLYDEHIQPLQKHFLRQCEQFSRIFTATEASLPEPEWFARHHARMVFKPSSAEVNFYSSLYHLENFGIFEFTNFANNKSISLVKRIKNFIFLLKNPSGVLETGTWPPIILNRLGLDFLRPIEGMKRFKRIFSEGSR